MAKRNGFAANWKCAALALTLLMISSGCSRSTTGAFLIKKIPAGSQETGFLSSYSKLKPDARFDNTRSYVSQDPNKNLHQYIAVIVDRPQVYVSTNVDETRIPEEGVAAVAEYFQSALTAAVESAYPVVQSPGPLVMRLRSAIVGVDVDANNPVAHREGKALPRSVNIGKVGVEMELVDSETGQQIAAAVDRESLGEGAEVGSGTFMREEKFRAAAQAFDGWAFCLRRFLDSASEPSLEDVARIEETNFPYANGTAPVK